MAARDTDLAAARRWFADDLRVTAPIRNCPALAGAFATVPREHFFPPGPWRLMTWSGLVTYSTPDADPRWLCHDVLIRIDEDRDLNNGQPSAWAYWLDHLELAPGERVLQIGAGTGYYSAILAETVGRDGTVLAVEADQDLARQAAANLAAWPQVTVIAGDGTKVDPGCGVDAIVVCAGATHPAPLWLDRLAPGGRMVLPLTTGTWSGFVLQVTRGAHGFHARSLGSCGFFPCVGARDDAAAARLHRALRRLGSKTPPVRSLHRGCPGKPRSRDIWYRGRDFWLSRRPLPSTDGPA